MGSPESIFCIVRVNRVRACTCAIVSLSLSFSERGKNNRDLVFPWRGRAFAAGACEMYFYYVNCVFLLRASPLSGVLQRRDKLRAGVLPALAPDK